MEWWLSPYYFTTFMMTFVKHLRSLTIPAPPGKDPRSRPWLRRGWWRGARILLYVDDFLLFASSEPDAQEIRKRGADLLDCLGLQRNPAKGLWEPVHGEPPCRLSPTAAALSTALVESAYVHCDSSRYGWDLEAMWGAHPVDRFALALNAMLPCYNAARLDPGCEAVDSLHLSDAEWRRENNSCNPHWPLMPDLV
eukprot:jgi/Tetstr1/443410/TSEL_031423.t1